MRIARSALSVVATTLLLFAGAAGAHAERRVALVIGNDHYANLPVLHKAAADANAYAELLKAKGFDQVILKTDLTRSGMDEAVAAFVDQIQPGDTALFAYSGHGWSDGTQNYIVGTDAPASGSQDLLTRISIPLRNGVNGVIDAMDQKNASLKVAIIDACRDNPFTPPAGKRSIGLSRGLARIDPPNGTFVVFSAGAGESALDRLSDGDADPNSVFTRVFVPALRADMTLQDAIKLTQAKVVELAKSIAEEQRPAYYDEVIGRACLSGACEADTGRQAVAPPMPPVSAPPAPAAAPAVDPAVAAYQAALAQNSVAAWDAFLAHFAEGYWSDLARAARQKLNDDQAAARAEEERQRQANANPSSTTDNAVQGSVEYSFVGPVLPPDPWLALRTAPSSRQGSRLLKMPEGTLFRVLRKQGDWDLVRLQDGTEGWANVGWIRCCKYLQE